MCGIVGFVDPAGRTPHPARVLAAMREALIHRGPDDAGELHAAPAWLGHRRLSIVDTSPAGRQPFVADGVACVANGEIYNHQALRARILAARPDAAMAASDCAVLPWLWRLEGPRFVERLVAMQAIALWDTRSQTLCLTRDLSGQKPLYWAELPGGGVAFASEPKALLRHPLIGRAVDPVALRRYLVYDYVPGADTIYRQIRRLPPASRLLWQGGAVRVERWAPVPFGPPWLTDLDAAADALWRTLGDAVQARLMADVPLGVFLSGGLDSTALVAALADRVDPSTLRTFAIGFDDPTFDESAAARTVARHFGTQHHEEVLRAADVMAMIPQVLAILDEPFADASLVPTFLLSRFARRHVTVALGGDGGDELLLGYPTFAADRLARLAARLPARLRRDLLAPLVARLRPSSAYMSLEFRARRFLGALDLPPDHRHPTWIGGVHPAEHAQALAPGLLAQAPDEAVFSDLDDLAGAFRAAWPDGDRLSLLAWQMLSTYLADGVLTKVDRASMAHGLEVRAPLLDARLVTLAGHLPSRLKLRRGQTKVVMRRMLAGRVPAAIVRRPKQGFGFPVGRWLAGPLRPWLESVLARDAVAAGGLLDPAWVSGLVAEHVAGRRDHRKPLWTALALELWRRGPYGPGG